jgi:hypothetical protein
MPDFNLEYGKGLFGEDVARTNYWDIIIRSPTFEHKKNRLIIEFDLPSVSVQGEKEEGTARIRDVATFHENTEFKVDYYIEKDYKNWLDYINWRNKIQDARTRQLSYFDEYKGNIVIMAYDIKHQLQCTVVLSDVYPKAISSPKFSHGRSELQKFSVNFFVKYMEIK